MLRELFDEPKRTDDGLFLQVSSAIENYRRRLNGQKQEDRESCGDNTRLQLWTKGFVNALDELEQSIYCTDRFRTRISKSYIETMTQEELNDYRRHVYFYKNAFIRLFSILDKLGHFINDLYDLETEKVKPRFSYFTVLRQMHQLRIEQELQRQLFHLKLKYQLPMKSLRNKRNLEIHLINVEMIDDLARADLCSADRTYVEDLDTNLSDLNKGFEMVCHSLHAVFTYTAGVSDRG